MLIVLICLFTGIAQGQEISVFSINTLGDNLKQSGFICTYSLGDAVTILDPEINAGFTNIVSELDPRRDIILKIFLEGLFDSALQMNLQAHSVSGPIFQEGIADTLSLRFYSFTTPPILLCTLHGVYLTVSGIMSIQIPDNLPLWVYLSIKHRNSLETWLSQPINTESGGFTDLTLSAVSSYGSNMKNVSGFFCIYAGDVNQDGVVDAFDLIQLDNQASHAVQGYFPEDLNGDAVVNQVDISIAENNAWGLVKTRKPQ